ncbi:hypothetical protein NITLEN_30344 [Nitrospira lenta]|uniref:Uncharacterized protein n=1 Tax=Nitrospira lenta TaxID=1436998 RepID=A0A330LEM1_9BACT|nr:hypothetical protein NITLEN_30344 [Nitrospira lenta]
MFPFDHFVIDLDRNHLRIDLLECEQIEDAAALDVLGFPIDLDLHGFSQVGLEIKEFQDVNKESPPLSRQRGPGTLLDFHLAPHTLCDPLGGVVDVETKFYVSGS